MEILLGKRQLLNKLEQANWSWGVMIAALLLGALGARIAVAYFLATDEPGDAVVYARLAINLLEHGTFSLSTEPPFDPTFIRLPGFPIFIAAVYAIFGHGNDLAVRIAEAFIDTATCVIAAALAYLWTAEEVNRRRNAMWTFALAAICPFVVIYAATLLTETLTTFFHGCDDPRRHTCV
jgi:4-amino-4-deoxy-L-arabinose transferase-like glycosyltransferase